MCPGSTGCPAAGSSAESALVAAAEGRGAGTPSDGAGDAAAGFMHDQVGSGEIPILLGVEPECGIDCAVRYQREPIGD